MHFKALKAIASGVRSQAELAERLVTDPPAVSRLVDRLVEDGLVVRQAGENRRCVRLAVSGAHHEEMALWRSTLEWLDVEMRRRLTEDEARELSRLLEKLRAGLSQEEAPPPPPEDAPGS